MSSYVKKNLVGSERLIYMGKKHRYCYVPYIVVLIIGILISTWTPEMSSVISDKLDEYESVTELRDGFSKKVDNIGRKVNRLAQDIGVSEHTGSMVGIIAELRKLYIGAILIFISVID